MKLCNKQAKLLFERLIIQQKINIVKHDEINEDISFLCVEITSLKNGKRGIYFDIGEHWGYLITITNDCSLWRPEIECF